MFSTASISQPDAEALAMTIYADSGSNLMNTYMAVDSISPD